MSNNVLVKVNGVSKKFCKSLKRSLWYGIKDISSELPGGRASHDKLRKNEFWAVDDVSFELERGECLGLIGPNGAGKSTLLKMLNGLVKPDRGQITMRGRVGALIELGAGFNPILTARENIYVNGAVLGLTKREVDRKFDSIIDFAEIEGFIDTPVQNFSSGMQVRLGFAIAAQMEPDVLLIDEVLAVGDVKFRSKCFDAISRMSKNCSVILVSHSMPSISRVSNRAICMRGSKVCYDGSTSLAVQEYLKDVSAPSKTLSRKGAVRNLTLKARNQSSSDWVTELTIDHGGDIELKASFDLDKSIEDFCLTISITDEELMPVIQVYSDRSGVKFRNDEGAVTVCASISNLLLRNGRYHASLHINEPGAKAKIGQLYGAIFSAIRIDVSDDFPGFAPLQLSAKWMSV